MTSFYLKATLTQNLLQWVGQEHLASLDIILGRRRYDAPHATVPGRLHFRPDDKEFLGEFRTQNLRLTDTPRRHGDRRTPQRILLGRSSQDKKCL